MKFKSSIKFNNSKGRKRVPAWQQIAKSWIAVHKKYMSNCYGDNAYYFNERASTSLLAAAAWHAGGIAIEEYKAPKKYEKQDYKGRIDLWFRLNEYEALIEAKHHFKTLNHARLEVMINDVNYFLSEAVQDVQNSLSDTTHGVATAFFTPRLMISDHKILDAVIAKAYEVQCDFFAYISSDYKHYKDYNPEMHYPIGFMFGRFVKKQEDE